MRRCVEIEWKEKKVLVFGAGNVALRKVKQYLQAEAELWVYSKEYLKEFEALPIHRLSTYEEMLEMLPKVQLALACTSCSVANEKFIAQARKVQTLVQSCQANQGQDCFSLVETRQEHLVLAMNTQESFPLGSKTVIGVLDKRMEELGWLRSKIKDISLLRMINDLEERELSFLAQAAKRKKALIYLLHGNCHLRAMADCIDLEQKAKERFGLPVYSLFLANLYRVFDLETWLSLFQAFDVDCTFVGLLMEQGRYHQACQILDPHWIWLDPKDYCLEGKNWFSHTRPTEDCSSVLVSMIYSPFLRSQHPDSEYLVLLEQPKAIERILHETAGIL